MSDLYFDEKYQDLEIVEDDELGHDIDDFETETENHLNRLMDISHAMENIITEGGVNRELAASFEDILDPTTPLNTFTKTPTKTNYNKFIASLEDKNVSMWVAIGVAIAALIAKVIMWIFDRKKGADDSNPEEVLKETDKVVAEAAKVEPEVVKNDKDAVDDIEERVLKSFGSQFTQFKIDCVGFKEDYIKAQLNVKTNVISGLITIVNRNVLSALKNGIKPDVPKGDTNVDAVLFNLANSNIKPLFNDMGLSSEYPKDGDPFKAVEALKEIIKGFNSEIIKAKAKLLTDNFKFIDYKWDKTNLEKVIKPSSEDSSNRNLLKGLEKIEKELGNKTELAKQLEENGDELSKGRIRFIRELVLVLSNLMRNRLQIQKEVINWSRIHSARASLVLRASKKTD